MHPKEEKLALMHCQGVQCFFFFATLLRPHVLGGREGCTLHYLLTTMHKNQTFRRLCMALGAVWWPGMHLIQVISKKTGGLGENTKKRTFIEIINQPINTKRKNMQCIWFCELKMCVGPIFL
jgi:hypothetical protein